MKSPRLYLCLFALGFCFELMTTSASQDLYLKNCASCHGKDGKAQTPIGKKLKVKDLSISTRTIPEIEKQIAQGFRENNGTVKMPPFQDRLSPAEIRSVAEYVVKFR